MKEEKVKLPNVYFSILRRGGKPFGDEIDLIYFLREKNIRKPPGRPKNERVNERVDESLLVKSLSDVGELFDLDLPKNFHGENVKLQKEVKNLLSKISKEKKEPLEVITINAGREYYRTYIKEKLLIQNTVSLTSLNGQVLDKSLQILEDGNIEYEIDESFLHNLPQNISRLLNVGLIEQVDVSKINILNFNNLKYFQKILVKEVYDIITEFYSKTAQLKQGIGKLTNYKEYYNLESANRHILQNLFIVNLIQLEDIVSFS